MRTPAVCSTWMMGVGPGQPAHSGKQLVAFSTPFKQPVEKNMVKLSLSKNDQKLGDHLAPATPTKTVAILNDFMLRKFWTVENHKDKKHFGCGLIT